MKTLVYNNSVIARDSATSGSKCRGNLSETTSDLNQGDCFVDNFTSLNSTLKTPRNDSPNFISRMILIGLLAFLLSPVSFAQDFDTNRMNRDIKIMENILGEMFKTQIISSEGTARVQVSGYTFFGSSSSTNVKGTYIPGYGVIFMIPSSSRSYVVSSRNPSDTKVIFQYSSDDDNSDKSIDKESITNRISEFLQDYASTIGQLKPDESILVIYGSANSSNRATAFSIRAAREAEEDKDQPEPLPVISVSAKKSDLDAYRSGSLNSDAFQNRLSVSESEDKQRLDLKVLGNIFSTALGEGDGNQFHLINSNSLSYMYLENFGALYSLNLHRGHGLGSLRSNIFFNTDRDNEDEIEEMRVDLEERERKMNDILEQEYEVLISKTKEFIIDYGRTLSSLKDGQFLMVSLNISDSNDIVPERVDFQVKKSTFNQLDKGQISREEALNAVTLTEY